MIAWINKLTALSVLIGIYSFLSELSKSSYFNPLIPNGGFANTLSNFLLTRQEDKGFPLTPKMMVEETAKFEKVQKAKKELKESAENDIENQIKTEAENELKKEGKSKS